MRLPHSTAEAVGKAVRLALVGRKWTIEREASDHVTAQLADERRSARVRIDYGPDSATVVVTEAWRFRVGPGGQRGKIKDDTSRPRTWAENLAKDIPVHLARIAILEK